MRLRRPAEVKEEDFRSSFSPIQDGVNRYFETAFGGYTPESTCLVSRGARGPPMVVSSNQAAATEDSFVSVISMNPATIRI